MLIGETLDSGSRVLERNLRSYNDNDPVHHMKRQAMVMGTTIESIQVYELLRAIELLRSCEARRTRTDDGDSLTRAHGRRLGRDPSLIKSPVRD